MDVVWCLVTIEEVGGKGLQDGRACVSLLQLTASLCEPGPFAQLGLLSYQVRVPRSVIRSANACCAV